MYTNGHLRVPRRGNNTINSSIYRSIGGRRGGFANAYYGFTNARPSLTNQGSRVPSYVANNNYRHSRIQMRHNLATRPGEKKELSPTEANRYLKLAGFTGEGSNAQEIRDRYINGGKLYLVNNGYGNEDLVFVSNEDGSAKVRKSIHGYNQRVRGWGANMNAWDRQYQDGEAYLERFRNAQSLEIVS